MIFCYLLNFFKKLIFFENSFKNPTRVLNSLNTDQDRSSASPDLGANCLQRLSADDLELMGDTVVCYKFH